MIAQQRIKGAVADLYISLSKARSEALKRNSSIRLAPLSGQWESGWTMFDTANPAVTMETHSSLKNLTINGPTSLTYRSSGRLSGAAAPDFDISGTGTDVHWCVSVDLSGKPYQKKSSC
jgi:type IV fimbrial biogenesis protein FimT